MGNDAPQRIEDLIVAVSPQDGYCPLPEARRADHCPLPQPLRRPHATTSIIVLCPPGLSLLLLPLTFASPSLGCRRVGSILQSLSTLTGRGWRRGHPMDRPRCTSHKPTASLPRHGDREQTPHSKRHQEPAGPLTIPRGSNRRIPWSSVWCGGFPEPASPEPAPLWNRSFA